MDTYDIVDNSWARKACFEPYKNSSGKWRLRPCGLTPVTNIDPTDTNVPLDTLTDEFSPSSTSKSIELLMGWKMRLTFDRFEFYLNIAPPTRDDCRCAIAHAPTPEELDGVPYHSDRAFELWKELTECDGIGIDPDAFDYSPRIAGETQVIFVTEAESFVYETCGQGGIDALRTGLTFEADFAFDPVAVNVNGSFSASLPPEDRDYFTLGRGFPINIPGTPIIIQVTPKLYQYWEVGFDGSLTFGWRGNNAPGMRFSLDAGAKLTSNLQTGEMDSETWVKPPPGVNDIIHPRFFGTPFVEGTAGVFLKGGLGIIAELELQGAAGPTFTILPMEEVRGELKAATDTEAASCTLSSNLGIQINAGGKLSNPLTDQELAAVEGEVLNTCGGNTSTALDALGVDLCLDISKDFCASDAEWVKIEITSIDYELSISPDGADIDAVHVKRDGEVINPSAVYIGHKPTSTAIGGANKLADGGPYFYANLQDGDCMSGPPSTESHWTNSSVAVPEGQALWLKMEKELQPQDELIIEQSYWGDFCRTVFDFEVSIGSVGDREDANDDAWVISGVNLETDGSDVSRFTLPSW